MPRHQMIKEKEHINDDFIPDGLEFKNEYFEQAMEMYQREKLILRWRKIGIAATSVAAAVGLLIVLQFANQDGSELQVNQHSADNSYGFSSEPQNEEIVVTREMTSKDVDSVKGMNNEEFSTPQENKASAIQPSESNHRQALNERAFVRENVVSSGATSSDSSPNYSGKAPGQGGATSSGVASHVRELVFNDHAVNIESSPLNERVSESLDNSQNATQQDKLNLGGGNLDSLLDQNLSIEMKEARGELTFLPYHLASFESATADLKPNMSLKIPKQNRLQFYLGTGIGIWADYGRNKESALPTGFFGEGGMDYALKGGWSTGMSAHAFLINQPKNPVLVESTKYGQGFNTTAQTVITDRLYYAGAQLYASKNIGQKNQVLLGYSVDYLITGNNTITTDRYASLESFPSEEIKAKGYVAGFENLNHAVVLEYRRAFGRYYAGCRGQLGLTDITKQGIFLYENKERNSLITVNLGLKLNS
jgi:hypothetical protein